METTIKDLKEVMYDLKEIRGRANEEKLDVDVAMNKRFTCENDEEWIEFLLNTLTDCKDYLDRLSDDIELTEYYLKRMVGDAEMEQLSLVTRGL